MDIEAIKSILEHRYPMLLIDGVDSIESMKSCHAFKILSPDEWFFSGHFPGNPVMPGSLQIEAFTQAMALPLLISGDRAKQKKTPLLLFAIDRVRYYKQVYPGDKFEIQVQIDTVAMGMASASVTGVVDSQKVSECKIAYKIRSHVL